ncbi:MAG: FtsX-like permease family protein [Microgenomates group bacterium]
MLSLLQNLRSLNYVAIVKELLFFGRFFMLVILFLFFDSIRILANIWPIRYLTKPLSSTASKIGGQLLKIFNSNAEGEISSLDLVHLAIRHLKAKKARTMITIGGMSIGFGSVIFLLSLGYGTQRLVISRVARLDEMKQITVTVGQATTLRLDDETLNTFQNMEGVESTLPMVSTVAKVNYNNSVSDVVVYAVSRAFLEESAIQPTRGNLFEDGEVVSYVKPVQGEVAGAEDEVRLGAKMYKELSLARYSIYPQVWKTVYAEPSEKAEIIGYTNRVPGEQDASEVWGELYSSTLDLTEGVDLFGNRFNPWIQDSFPIWAKTNCTADNPDCIDGTFEILKNGMAQRYAKGYVTEDDLSIQRYQIISEAPNQLSEGSVLSSIQFSIPNSRYVKAFGDTENSSEVTTIYASQQKAAELFSGELVVGEAYSDPKGWGSVGVNQNGRTVGLWVRAKVPLWRKLDCGDCADQYLRELDPEGVQIISQTVLKASDLSIDDLAEAPKFGSVLGETTENTSETEVTTASSSATPTTLQPTSSASSSAELEELPTEIELGDGTKISARMLEDGSVDWVSIATDSADVTTEDREVVPFTANSKREVVVNEAMLSMLGITIDEALSKSFDAVILLDQEFFVDQEKQVESESALFTIIGVIPGDKNAAYYLPFTDLKGMGVENYSQMKVVVSDQSKLPDIRQKIESLGFKTTSVTDTVGKINSLFDTIRVVLTILGLVALSVAALGMFNTLTVSLLEKTREVGLMKTIGMKSNEVKRLFIAESIVMGLSGGIFGLILSTAAGYGLSAILSTISVTKGLGYINLVYTPLYLAVGIVATAFLVGVLTGLYPSYRATKISALNALRYE